MSNIFLGTGDLFQYHYFDIFWSFFNHLLCFLLLFPASRQRGAQQTMLSGSEAFDYGGLRNSIEEEWLKLSRSNSKEIQDLSGPVGTCRDLLMSQRLSEPVHCFSHWPQKMFLALLQSKHVKHILLRPFSTEDPTDSAATTVLMRRSSSSICSVNPAGGIFAEQVLEVYKNEEQLS